MVDCYHWESEAGYRVCVSQTPGEPPVWLAWAPRDPDNPRSPGELIGPGVATRQAAYDQAEAHLAGQQARAATC